MIAGKKKSQMCDITKHPIGKSKDIFLYRLSNANIEVEISNYGCTIVSINTPDRHGKKANIVASLENFEDYTKDHPYLGCVVGRYANRIAFGKFRIGNADYVLPVNDGQNHLHGGYNGFNRKVWKPEAEIKEYDRVGIQFTYLSEDGEEGYPGDLKVSVTYVLTNSDALVINYEAVTNKPTIVNLTNHSYFNLSGFQTPTIYEHLLKVNAHSYTEKNSNNIPTGNFNRVLNTPYDFLQFKKIGERIHSLCDDRGYDINYVLDGSLPAVELYDPFSGRLLKVFTDTPGVQVYTANWWDGTLKGSHNHPYLQHAAVALEAQAFPDAPNHPHFPDTALYPGQLFKTQTTFQFMVEKNETVICG
ncbi:MAG TPA: aldose epimerase family protein [Phnomibacter sp.]|nr:aldose epimerase family protein [Phnomibacter sp.]